MNNLIAEEIKLAPQAGQFFNLQSLSFTKVVSALISGALVIAAIIFFFMLVIGGIKWIASGGDKGATEGARNQITAALVGLVIVFAAWAIAGLIKTFFGGIDIFNLTLPSAL
jgi:uncharacterized membrane protein (UPF0182 family)